MSKTLVENVPLVVAKSVKPLPTVKASQLADLGSLSPWKWCAITCLFLSLSGGVRLWRDLQFQSVYHESEVSQFPLSDIPKSLGTWRAVEGQESQLDPEIARVAGSTDHFIRFYTDSKTGETVSVLVLYGPAAKVHGHHPLNCYPAAGYQTLEKPVDREFRLSGLADPVKFTMAYFARNVGGVSEFNEALWTFRHNGEWQADMNNRWKSFRYHPAMYKIQIHRPVMSMAIEDSPSESLLKEIVREIESRIALSEAGKTNGSSPASQAVAK